MSMSRKDYIAIANVLANRRPLETALPKIGEAINVRIDGIAKDLADNSRFDRSRFLDACGVGFEGEQFSEQESALSSAEIHYFDGFESPEAEAAGIYN
jgi:hypothetical protein